MPILKAPYKRKRQETYKVNLPPPLPASSPLTAPSKPDPQPSKVEASKATAHQPEHTWQQDIQSVSQWFT